jgi:hypothetical protein
MNELRHARDFRDRGEALLQPVLDRLDVVVGRPLDGLDPRGVGRAETFRGRREQLAQRRGESGHFADAGFIRQCDEPGDLDANTGADQTEFAEVRGERRDLGRVPAIERRKGGERGIRGRHRRVKRQVGVDWRGRV